MKTYTQHLTHGLIAAAVLSLTACGGGGGGSSASAPATSSLVTGVAATGLAIPNGTVTLKCVAGTPASVATDVNGAFTVDVSSATLPCIARIDYTDSATRTPAKLHSLVRQVGTANITPVTDLLVATLTKGKASDAYDKFNASEVKNLSDSDVNTASTAVKSYLHDKLQLDTSKLPDDLIGTPLVAATAANPTRGDDTDKVLDRLKSKHESDHHTLGDVEDDLVKVTTTPVVVTSTETQTLTCPAGQTGAIGQQRTVTTTNGVASNAAWATVTNTCTAGSTPTPATPAPQTVTFAQPTSQTLGVTPAVLSATASSGLAVSFASNTPSVCTVSGATLTLMAGGNCTITANQAGNASFAAATTVTRTFAVAAAPVVVVTSAANGKALYVANSCSGCHGMPPSTQKVLNGANKPNTILSAINSIGAMSSYKGKFATQDLNDMAAYLATPGI